VTKSILGGKPFQKRSRLRPWIFPACVAGIYLILLVLNLFITPVHVSRFMGSGAGVRGVLLSAVAGIISMGPIFAWYPFLESLRIKGASDFHLANFLSHRAVKPALLPMMIIYFGWRFSLVFTVFCSLSALVTAMSVGLLGRQR